MVLNPHEGDVPVDSEADWYATVVAPARKGFEAAGVPVSDLSDDQVMDASARILDEFGGEMPDLIDIGRIVDGVRFEAKLVEDEPWEDEPCPRCKGRTWTWNPKSGRTPCTCVAAKLVEGEDEPDGNREPVAPSTSHRCDGCTPHFLAHTPTGGGWFHERSCTVHPFEKLITQPRTNGRRAQQNVRRAERHRIEDSRTALYIRPRRPEVLHPFAVHESCLAAFREGADACMRCTPLLHPGSCECAVCDEWWARVDG